MEFDKDKFDEARFDNEIVKTDCIYYRTEKVGEESTPHDTTLEEKVTCEEDLMRDRVCPENCPKYISKSK